MTDGSSQPKESKNSTAPKEPMGHAKAREAVAPWKKFAKLAGLAVGCILLFSGSLFVAMRFAERAGQQADIVIGDVTITPDDIERYARMIETYKQSNPDADFGGEPKQVALDDLVLNAAFKHEAKQFGELIPDELDSVMQQKHSNEEERRVYFEALEQSETGKMTRVRAENEAYRRKFKDQLLARKNLLMLNIPYDTPYHSSNPDKISELHRQAVDRLTSEFLPLFEAKVPREAIAEKVDVIVYDEDTTDNKNYQQYFDGLVTVLDYREGYLAGETTFNDLEDTEYMGVPIENLHGTNEKIDGLVHVGDFTEVFAAKSGGHMIIRLESKSQGIYNSWTDFLDAYKREYVAASAELSAAMALKSKVEHFGERVGLAVTSVGLQTAQAQSAGQCATHNVTFRGRSYDTLNLVRIGGTRFSHYRRAHNCGPQFTGTKVATVAWGGEGTIADNCFGPEPTWNILGHPAGYNYVGMQSSDGTWNGQFYPGWPRWSTFTINQIGTVYIDFYYHPAAPADQPPSGTLTRADCNVISFVASDPNGTPQVSITIDGTTVHLGYGSGSIAYPNWAKDRSRTVRMYVVNRGPNGGVIYHAASSPRTVPACDQPPSGTLTRADCNVITFTASDPNGTPQVRVTIDGNTVHQGSGSGSIAYPNSYKNASSHTVRVYIINSGPSGSYTVEAAGSPRVVPPCDQAPNFSLSANCNTITISNLSDPNNGGNVPIQIRVNGQLIYNSSTRGTFTVAFPAANQNAGSYTVTARAFSLRPDGSQDFGFYADRSVTVGPCVAAQCSGGSADGFGPQLVMAGGQFSIAFTLRNSGQMSWNVGGRLTARINNYNGQSPSAGVPATAPGGTARISFGTLTAANTTSAQTVTAQLILDGRVLIAVCTVTFDPYVSFSLEPIATSGMLSPNEENPSSFTFNSGVNVRYTEVPNANINFGGPVTRRVITRNGVPVPGGTFISTGTYLAPFFSPSPQATVSVLRPFQAGDRYCGAISVSGTRGIVNRLGNVRNLAGSAGPIESCDTIMDRPYLRAYNGDVIAGIGFGEGCTQNAEAKIIGYNNGNGSGQGASVQFASQAFHSIEGYSSATGRNTHPSPNKGLSLSNDTGTPSFGGGFGSAHCLPDYAGSRPNITADPSPVLADPSALGSGDHYFRPSGGTLTIRTTGTPISGRVVVYVEGDAVISNESGNGITYGGSNGWATDGEGKAQLPAFYLIATGNIYIESTVTELNGVYIAQPSGGTGGIIYTCTQGAQAVAANNLHGTCNHKLTVYGALIADRIKFLRTVGSVRSSGNNETIGSATVGEEIIYTPETWINNPLPVTTRGSVGRYDAISSLPPIL